MNQHEFYIRRCIELAKLGTGNVSPNPLVGCVIVHNEKIIGEGWHKKFGEAHAEVNAINNVFDKTLLPHSILYVSLEPCHHFGKTPPCVDLILSHKIKTVVIASMDPNPKVAGKSIQKLMQSNVDVIVGVCNDAAQAINKGFFSQQKQNRPYIILKWAQSKNGYFAPLEGQQWLSNEQTKRLTHKWRNEVDAILVGKNTVLQDNPALSDRFWQGHHPLRIVIDPQLEINERFDIYKDGKPTLIFNSLKTEQDKNVQFIQLKEEYFPVDAMIQHLNTLNINTLLVEGGAFTLNNFIKSNFWDEAYIYKTDVEIIDGIDVPKINDYANRDVQKLSNNTLEIFYNR